jgi:hypothetical protein
MRSVGLTVCLMAAQCHAGLLHARDSLPAGYAAAPYYPTPHGGWLSSWTDAYAKAQALVSNMTLAEKTNITGGSGYLMGLLYNLSWSRLLRRLIVQQGQQHLLARPFQRKEHIG